MMAPYRMLSWLRASRCARRRRKASRGQALLEFALFVPLLLFMVIGATDISTLLDDHLNVVYAVRAGARVGSVVGKFAPAAAPYTADCAIVGAVQAALSGSRNVQVSKIAIYQANANGAPISAALQDIYPGNAVCNSNGSVTPVASQTGWPPSVRNTTPFLEDSLGVAITYTYTFQFNPLADQFNPQGGSQLTMTDSAVMPIEIVVSNTAP